MRDSSNWPRRLYPQALRRLATAVLSRSAVCLLARRLRGLVATHAPPADGDPQRRRSPGTTSRPSTNSSTPRGIDSRTFPAYVDRLRQTHAARVREGDLDHLIFYILQSTGVHHAAADRAGAQREGAGRGPRTEPEREAFLRTGAATRRRAYPTPCVRGSEPCCARCGAPSRDARLLYFGELVPATFPRAADRARRSAARVPARDALRLPEGIRRAAARSRRPKRWPSSTDRAA